MRDHPRDRAQICVGAGAALLAATMLTACSPATTDQQPDPVQSSALDAEFRERIDRELPGVFKPEEQGMVPLAALVKFHCGALTWAEDPDAAVAAGAPDAGLYRQGADHVREHLVTLWSKDIAHSDATTLVDVSIEMFCPSLLSQA